MKKFSFFALITALVSFTSCGKEDLSPGSINYTGFSIPNFYFYSGTLEYVHLPVNRHFIYKDAATGSTDSVIVSQSIVTKEITSVAPLYTYEKYALTLSGTMNPTWFNGIANCHSFPGYSLADNVDPNFSLSNEQYGLPAFWYPFTSAGALQYTFIPALTIEGISYTGVNEFSASNGLQTSDANYLQIVHYWVKGIGIIKKEVHTNSSVKTYLLLRYG